MEPSGPVQELLYLPFTFLHPCKENYFTRNKEQTGNFAKDKESMKKRQAGETKRKGESKIQGQQNTGTAKYSDSKIQGEQNTGTAKYGDSKIQ